MMKLVAFVAILAVAYGLPAPEPKPAAKPDPYFASIAAPLVAAPISYTAAYSAPVAYASYAYPSYAYSADYVAYSPYAATIVV